MATNFSFIVFFFLFFILTICLLRATTYAIDDLPSWNIISNVGIILEGLAFGSRLLVSFLSRGKIWLKSIPEKWAIFGQCALRHQSRWFQSVTILEPIFGYWKRFGRFEAVASLDAYQITNYQFPLKTHHFFVAWFLFRPNRIFQVHDMTINFSFVFLFFVFFVVCLLRATTHIIDDLLDWSISSHMRTVLRGLAFGSRLLISFLSRER